MVNILFAKKIATSLLNLYKNHKMAQTLTNMAAVRHVGLLLSAQQTIHHVTLIKGNFVSFGLIAFFIFQKFSLNGVRKE